MEPIDDFMDYSQHSDPSINTAVLPDSHPIHLIEEARTFYEGRKPPFVLRKSNENARALVIPTASGTRPQIPTTVEAKARGWDDKTMFWTLDLNNTRYIVKAFSGAPPKGALYRYWDGSKDGFDQKPLAFTVLNHRPFHDVAHVTDEDPSNEGDDDDDTEVPINVARARRVVRALGPSGKPTPSDSESTYQPADRIATPNLSKTRTKEKRSKRHSEQPLRTASAIEEATSPRKRRKTDISIRELNLLGNPTNSSPRERHRKVQDADVRAETSASPTAKSAVHRAAQPTSKPNISSVTQQSAEDGTGLPEYKLKRTTLVVRVSPATEYQPLKLSECPSVEMFYDKVLGVWDLAESSVAKVTVGFTWLEAGDKMRTMLINKKQEASFHYLLEEVDECPCWKEPKGKCLLDVDIIMKG